MNPLFSVFLWVLANLVANGLWVGATFCVFLPELRVKLKPVAVVAIAIVGIMALSAALTLMGHAIDSSDKANRTTTTVEIH